MVIPSYFGFWLSDYPGQRNEANQMVFIYFLLQFFLKNYLGCG